MKKTNLNITQSKKIISDYAGQIKDVIRNNKIIVNLIDYKKNQICINKKFLLKYTESNDSKEQIVKTFNIDLTKENNYIHENNLKLIKEIQMLKEKVKE